MRKTNCRLLFAGLAGALLAASCSQDVGLTRTEDPVPVSHPADEIPKPTQSPKLKPPAREISKLADSAAKSLSPETKALPDYPAVSLNNPFKLKYAQQFSLPNSQLNFKISRVRDDRCPLEMHCANAGSAVVTLTLYRVDERIDALNIDANGARATIQDGPFSFRFELLELQPYPTVQSIDPQHYVAELVVTRSGIP